MVEAGEILQTVGRGPACAKQEAVAAGSSPQQVGWHDAAASAVIVGVALTLAWHTWACWGDLQIDCGRELYVPLQIVHGELLYRDVWYDYGPLTPYVEAALIWFFGPHLDLFYGFGTTLAIGCALLLYRAGATLEGRVAGLAAALAILFGGFGPSIFNYAFPYAYAALLGLLLSLLCAWWTISFLLQEGRRRLMLAGVVAGLATLCKPEFGAACYAMLAFMVGMRAATVHSMRPLLRDVLEWLPGVLICAAIYGWFFHKVGFRFILFHNWVDVPGSYFMRTYGARYVAQAGLRLVPAEIVFLLVSAAGCLFVWFWIAKGRRLERGRVGGWLFLVSAATLAAGVAAARYTATPGHAGYLIFALLLVFPPGMFLIGCGFFLYTVRKFLSSGRERPRLVAEATFIIFALALAFRLLAEMIPQSLGVFYGPPLLLVFIATLSRCFGAAGSGLEDGEKRELIGGLLAVEVVLLAIVLVPVARARTVPFETGWGTIYLTPGDAAGARRIFSFMSDQERSRHRVVILPELPMMYAFTDTEAPSRWYKLTPEVLSRGEEQEYISDLRRATPRYIIITNRNTSEYGVAYFGIDYDREIYRWIEDNYRVAGRFGEFRREKGAPLAALIYQRRSGPVENELPPHQSPQAPTGAAS